MNVQDQKLEDTIADLQHKLDAANQRIAELEAEAARANDVLAFHLTRKIKLQKHAEAAEAKLAKVQAVVDAIESKGRLLLKGRHWPNGIAEDRTPLVEWVQEIAQIEQPQQQLPGEDPDGKCQCAACVKMRGRMHRVLAEEREELAAIIKDLATPDAAAEWIIAAGWRKGGSK